MDKESLSSNGLNEKGLPVHHLGFISFEAEEVRVGNNVVFCFGLNFPSHWTLQTVWSPDGYLFWDEDKVG